MPRKGHIYSTAKTWQPDKVLLKYETLYSVVRRLEKVMESDIMLIINKKEYIKIPEISLFYGIKVTMYYDDHNPPHFHAEYNGNKIIVDIVQGKVIKGGFPSKQLKLILAWTIIHQDELMQNWELSKVGKPLNRINPLI